MSVNVDLLQDPAVQNYIADNVGSDVNKIALKKGMLNGVPYSVLANQILCHKKSKSKMPSWYSAPGILYPSTRSVEQASSEMLAKFKFKNYSGQKAVDLTGGMGVDSWILSKHFEKVIYVEKDEYLAEIACRNFETLGLSNIEVLNQEAEEVLAKNSQIDEKFDLVYIDPSRRGKDNSRVFLFSDCHPNVLELANELSSISREVLIKASPLVDLSYGFDVLKSAKKAHVVSYKSEVKEVLFQIGGQKQEPATISCFDLRSSEEFDELSFSPYEEENTAISFGVADIGDYLYLPNRSLLKAGAFKTIAKTWGLDKHHKSTHLYSSSVLRKGFHGRILVVKDIYSSLNKASNALKGHYLNIVSKNFPLAAQMIKTKLGTIDGGSDYLICANSVRGARIYFGSIVKE